MSLLTHYMLAVAAPDVIVLISSIGSCSCSWCCLVVLLVSDIGSCSCSWCYHLCCPPHQRHWQLQLQLVSSLLSSLALAAAGVAAWGVTLSWPCLEVSLAVVEVAWKW